MKTTHPQNMSNFFKHNAHSAWLGNSQGSHESYLAMELQKFRITTQIQLSEVFAKNGWKIVLEPDGSPRIWQASSKIFQGDLIITFDYDTFNVSFSVGKEDPVVLLYWVSSEVCFFSFKGKKVLVDELAEYIALVLADDCSGVLRKLESFKESF